MNEAIAQGLWFAFIAIVFCGSAFAFRNLAARLACGLAGIAAAGGTIYYWTVLL